MKCRSIFLFFAALSACNLLKLPIKGRSPGSIPEEPPDVRAEAESSLDFYFTPENNSRLKIGESASHPARVVAGTPMKTKLVPSKRTFKNFRITPDLPRGYVLSRTTGAISSNGSSTLPAKLEKYLVEADEITSTLPGNPIKVFGHLYFEVLPQPSVSGNFLVTKASESRSIASYLIKLPVGENTAGLVHFDGTPVSDLGFHFSITQTPTSFPINRDELAFSESILSNSSFQASAQNKISKPQSVSLLVKAENEIGYFQMNLSFESQPIPTGFPPKDCSYRRAQTDYKVGQSTDCNAIQCLGGGAAASFELKENQKLPAGLSLNPTSGSICGTPTQISGSATYTINALNSFGVAQAQTQISVTESIAPPQIKYPWQTYYLSASAIPVGAIKPELFGGLSTRITATPDPSTVGISFDSKNGAFSGTMNANQTRATFIVTAENAGGSNFTTVTFDRGNAVAYQNSTISLNVGESVTNLLLNAPPKENISGFSLASTDPDLPAGITLNSSDGSIQGKATSSFARTNYTVFMKMVYGYAIPIPLSIQVIAPGEPPKGVTYSFNPAPYTRGVAINPINTPQWAGGRPTSFAVISGTLPTGVQLDPVTGNIFGTPVSVSDLRIVTIRASNSWGSTDVKLVISVSDPPVRGFRYSLNSFELATGSSYTIQPTFLGGFAPTSWKIRETTGSGPSSPLVFSNGQFSGVPSAVMPSTAYEITGTQAVNGVAESYSQVLSFSVKNLRPGVFAYPKNPYSEFVGTTLLLNTPVFSVVGGNVKKWTIEPAVPNGMSFDQTNGQIYGRAEKPLDILFRVTAINDDGNSSAEVRYVFKEAGPFSYDPGEIQYLLLAKPTNGNFLSAVPNPSISNATFSILSGRLPDGLSLNANSGQIQGTVNSPFERTIVQVQAKIFTAVLGETKLYSGVTRVGSFTLESKNLIPKLEGVSEKTIGQATAFNFFTGQAAEIKPLLHVQSGVPEKFEINTSYGGSTLPVGWSFNSTTGILIASSSVAIAAGTYSISASNSAGKSTPVTFTVSFAQIQSNAEFTYSPNFFKIPRDPYRSVIGEHARPVPAFSTERPFTFSAIPPLPNGLRFRDDGVIIGDPTTLTTNTRYKVIATNSISKHEGNVTFLVHDASTPRLINYKNKSSGIESTSFTLQQNSPVTLEPVKVYPVEEYASGGGLPAGLSLDPKTGVISGTPSSITNTTNVKVRATNGAGTEEIILTFTISEPLDQFGYNPPSALVVRRVGVSAFLAASPNIQATDWLFSLAEGSPRLPRGVELSPSTGKISGTPAIGLNDTTFNVLARNGFDGRTKTGSFTLKVADDHIQGFHYVDATTQIKLQELALKANHNFKAEPRFQPGGLPSEYSISPPLPFGLNLDPLTGVISGTASPAIDRTEFTVTIRNLITVTSYSFYLTISSSIQTFYYSSGNCPVDRTNFSFGLFRSRNVCTLQPTFNPKDGYRFSFSPALPDFFKLDPVSGEIKGSPSELFNKSQYTITATSPTDAIRYVGTFELQVVDAVPSSFNYWDSPHSSSYPYFAKVGETRLDLRPKFIGFDNLEIQPWMSFSINPPLPPGLSLDPQSGRITGVATAEAVAVRYKVTANNSKTLISTDLKIITHSGPDIPFYYDLGPITWKRQLNEKNIEIYAAPLIPSGRYKYSISPNVLPEGVIFSEDAGYFKGVPKKAFSKTLYTVLARNLDSPVTFKANFQIEVIDYPIKIESWTLTDPANAGTLPNLGIVLDRDSSGIAKPRDIALIYKLTSDSGEISEITLPSNLPSNLALNSNATSSIGGTIKGELLDPNATYNIKLGNSTGAVTLPLKIVATFPPNFKNFSLGGKFSKRAILSLGRAMPPLELHLTPHPLLTNIEIVYSPNSGQLPSGLQFTRTDETKPFILSGTSNSTKFTKILLKDLSISAKFPPPFNNAIKINGFDLAPDNLELSLIQKFTYLNDGIFNVELPSTRHQITPNPTAYPFASIGSANYKMRATTIEGAPLPQGVSIDESSGTINLVPDIMTSSLSVQPFIESSGDAYIIDVPIAPVTINLIEKEIISNESIKYCGLLIPESPSTIGTSVDHCGPLFSGGRILKLDAKMENEGGQIVDLVLPQNLMIDKSGRIGFKKPNEPTPPFAPMKVVLTASNTQYSKTVRFTLYGVGKNSLGAYDPWIAPYLEGGPVYFGKDARFKLKTDPRVPITDFRIGGNCGNCFTIDKKTWEITALHKVLSQFSERTYMPDFTVTFAGSPLSVLKTIDVSFLFDRIDTTTAPWSPILQKVAQLATRYGIRASQPLSSAPFNIDKIASISLINVPWAPAEPKFIDVEYLPQECLDDPNFAIAPRLIINGTEVQPGCYRSNSLYVNMKLIGMLRDDEKALYFFKLFAYQYAGSSANLMNAFSSGIDLIYRQYKSQRDSTDWTRLSASELSVLKEFIQAIFTMGLNDKSTTDTDANFATITTADAFLNTYRITPYGGLYRDGPRQLTKSESKYDARVMVDPDAMIGIGAILTYFPEKWVDKNNQINVSPFSDPKRGRLPTQIHGRARLLNTIACSLQTCRLDENTEIIDSPTVRDSAGLSPRNATAVEMQPNSSIRNSFVQISCFADRSSWTPTGCSDGTLEHSATLSLSIGAKISNTLINARSTTIGSNVEISDSQITNSAGALAFRENSKMRATTMVSPLFKQNISVSPHMIFDRGTLLNGRNIVWQNGFAESSFNNKLQRLTVCADEGCGMLTITSTIDLQNQNICNAATPHNQFRMDMQSTIVDSIAILKALCSPVPSP